MRAEPGTDASPALQTQYLLRQRSLVFFPDYIVLLLRRRHIKAAAAAAPPKRTATGAAAADAERGFRGTVGLPVAGRLRRRRLAADAAGGVAPAPLLRPRLWHCESPQSASSIHHGSSLTR